MLKILTFTEVPVDLDNGVFLLSSSNKNPINIYNPPALLYELTNQSGWHLCESQ